MALLKIKLTEYVLFSKKLALRLRDLPVTVKNKMIFGNFC